jgi:hypothetical protein
MLALKRKLGDRRGHEFSMIAARMRPAERALVSIAPQAAREEAGSPPGRGNRL